jgi:hypothetical protein
MSSPTPQAPVVVIRSTDLGGTESGIEVGQDVIEGLESDTQANEIRGDSRRQLLRLGEL